MLFFRSNFTMILSLSHIKISDKRLFWRKPIGEGRGHLSFHSLFYAYLIYSYTCIGVGHKPLIVYKSMYKVYNLPWYKNVWNLKKR